MTLRKPSVSLPRLRLGHITDAYLASALRAFVQICPIGRTSDMRQPLSEIAFKIGD